MQSLQLPQIIKVLRLIIKRDSLEAIFKSTRRYIIITFIIGCLIFVIDNLFFGTFYNKSINEHLTNFIINQLFTFVLSYLNIKYFLFLIKLKFDKYEVIKRILLGVVGTTVITLVVVFLLRLFIIVLFYGQSIEYFFSNESWRGYSFSLWITLTIVSVFYIIYFYNRYQKNRIKEQKIIAGTASAQFDALKNQLDPHFLFNSLNVLTSLIDENPDAAQNFTTSLSKVYRYVLEQKNKGLISVDEELKFARTYVRLLKMRFEDSIVFEIPDNASNAEAKVVPLSLQLLLENAVKHNIVNSSNPLKIRIFERDGHLVVENVLQPKEVLKNSTGVGLANIKQRYSLLSNRQVKINKTALHFSVAIPMLTKQVSILKTQPQEEYIEDKRYEKARKKVQAIKGFYSNLLSYAIVIPFLAFVNYRTTDFPWEERKIREFMEKEESKNI